MIDEGDIYPASQNILPLHHCEMLSGVFASKSPANTTVNIVQEGFRSLTSFINPSVSRVPYYPILICISEINSAANIKTNKQTNHRGFLCSKKIMHLSIVSMRYMIKSFLGGKKKGRKKINCN